MSPAAPRRQPRRLADFGGREGLRPAERRLLAERDTGLPVILGDGTLPPADPPEDRRVRASVLRWLILGAEGADGRTHESGVQVAGAFVESDGPEGAETRGLDLEGCIVTHDINLLACRFESLPLLRSARLAELFLNASHLPGLNAERVETTGGVFLRGLQSTGPIRLIGARIGSTLECDGASLRNPGGATLHADRVATTGDVFLRHGFESEGEIRLLGARIGGNLDCDGARLRHAGDHGLSGDGLTTVGNLFLRDVESDGEIRLVGARIGGSLECDGATLRNAGGASLNADGVATTRSVFLRDAFVSDGAIRLPGARIGGDIDCGGAAFRNAPGTALDCRLARIDGALLLRNGATAAGRIDVAAAEIGSIIDDPGCWPETVRLDRCSYKAFAGTDWSVEARIGWLDSQDPADGFRPQPWEHCARVLRESGHAEAARAVLIAKEVRQRRARRAAAAAVPAWGLWLWDGLIGATVRYGRRPMLAFAWLLGFWLLGSGVFWGASALDAVKPNSPVVLRAPEWVLCGVETPRRVFVPSLQRLATGRALPGESQRACFERQPEARQYPRFNAPIYAADTLLPVVALEMQTFWIPDEGAAPPWGWLARWYLWVQVIVGWALTLLAVAGFSGIVKSE